MQSVRSPSMNGCIRMRAGRRWTWSAWMAQEARLDPRSSSLELARGVGEVGALSGYSAHAILSLTIMNESIGGPHATVLVLSIDGYRFHRRSRSLSRVH